MDRYFVRCVTQLISPTYKSYHLLGIADFKKLFQVKRLDVMPHFTNYGTFNGVGNNDTPVDPTDEQMRAFAEKRKITCSEAWHRFRGELTMGRFALQATGRRPRASGGKEEGKVKHNGSKMRERHLQRNFIFLFQGGLD